MSRSSRSAINAGVSGGLSKEEKALGYMRENLTVHKSDNWRLTNDSRIPHSKELDLLIAIKREKSQRRSGKSNYVNGFCFTSEFMTNMDFS